MLSPPSAEYSTPAVGRGGAAAFVCVVVPPFWHAASKQAHESGAADASAALVKNDSIRRIFPALPFFRRELSSKKGSGAHIISLAWIKTISRRLRTPSSPARSARRRARG